MLRRGAVLLAIAAVATGQGQGAVPVTNETYTTRACRPGFDHFSFCNTSLSRDARLDSLIELIHEGEYTSRMTARPAQASGVTGNISRLGLPAYDWGLNCLHGVQGSCVKDLEGKIYCPTSFPNPVNLGASWNSSMWKTMGHVIGKEVRALWLAGGTEYANGSGRPRMGLDCWSPNININHDPRWGRNQEVPSEDPFVNGLYGAQVTRGQQYSEEDPHHVMTIVTLKHWDAYTLEDSDGYTRHTFNAVVDNTTFADTFFPAWRASVKDAGALGVMCSYNEVNGVPSCANTFLQSVLRDTFNFKGYVTSDSGAVVDFYAYHHWVQTKAEAACLAIKAETDVDSGDVYFDSLLDGVNQGLCTLDDVKKSLRNSLGVQFDMGLFDPVEEQPYWHMPLSTIGAQAHIEASKLATREGMVLLRNEEVLPLPKGKTIALIGPHVNTTRMLVGNYFGQICADNTFDCVETIYHAMGRYNMGGNIVSAEGCNISGNSTAGFSAALQAVDQADIVVLAMGIDQTVEAEAHDRTAISLPGVQAQLIQQVVSKGKPTAMVMLNGGMVSLGDLRNKVGALVEAFYPSVYGGDAIAATLFGDNENLGGKMPYTVYPAEYVSEIKMDVMSMNDPATPGRSYKYYTGATEYDFGFGLSLTSFKLEVVGTVPTAVSCEDTAGVKMQVKVTNTGSVTGDEVVMLYRKAGRTGAGLPLVKKIIGFERVHLAPSASSVVVFTVVRDDFADVVVSGDQVCTPQSGKYSLLVTNGGDQVLTFPIATTGSMVKTKVFPDV